MPIKIIAAKCPECGANFDLEEGRKQAFCAYCGTKLLIDNENEYVYRRIDEAGLKQAETDHIVQLKKMELAEKRRAAREKRRTFKIIISIIIGIFMIISFIIGYSDEMSLGGLVIGMIFMCILLMMWQNGSDDDDDDFEDKIRMPAEVVAFEGKNYISIKTLLEEAGFTNVRCIPLSDLKMGILIKPKTIESITVNGKTIENKRYNPDAKIVISYHSLNR